MRACTHCVRLCVCRIGSFVRRSRSIPPSPPSRVVDPPPSLPGAHVCGTPTARILFRPSWSRSDFGFALLCGERRGQFLALRETPTDLMNNEDNVRPGYYAIFVINVIELVLSRSPRRVAAREITFIQERLCDKDCDILV